MKILSKDNSIFVASVVLAILWEYQDLKPLLKGIERGEIEIPEICEFLFFIANLVGSTVFKVLIIDILFRSLAGCLEHSPPARDTVPDRKTSVACALAPLLIMNTSYKYPEFVNFSFLAVAFLCQMYISYKFASYCKNSIVEGYNKLSAFAANIVLASGQGEQTNEEHRTPENQ